MALSLLNNKNQKDDKGENRVWFIPEYERGPALFALAAFPSLLLLRSGVHTVSLPINSPSVNKENINDLHSVTPAVT